MSTKPKPLSRTNSKLRLELRDSLDYEAVERALADNKITLNQAKALRKWFDCVKDVRENPIVVDLDEHLVSNANVEAKEKGALNNASCLGKKILKDAEVPASSLERTDHIGSKDIVALGDDSIIDTEGMSLDEHRNPLYAPNARFTQEFVAELTEAENGLTVIISQHLNGLTHPILEVGAETLLSNYLYFMEAGEVGCITKEFESISKQLREWADRIDHRTKLLNEQSRTNCCKFCDG